MMGVADSSSRFLSAGLGALLGAAAGFALGLVFLLIGIVRVVLVIAFGGDVQPVDASDVRLGMFYIGALMSAGAVVGIVAPVIGGRGGVYIACALAGVIVMNVLAIADGGSWGAGGARWIIMTVIGVIFGLAGARGFLGKA